MARTEGKVYKQVEHKATEQIQAEKEGRAKVACQPSTKATEQLQDEKKRENKSCTRARHKNDKTIRPDKKKGEHYVQSQQSKPQEEGRGLRAVTAKQTMPAIMIRSQSKGTCESSTMREKKGKIKKKQGSKGTKTKLTRTLVFRLSQAQAQSDRTKTISKEGSANLHASRAHSDKTKPTRQQGIATVHHSKATHAKMKRRRRRRSPLNDTEAAHPGTIANRNLAHTGYIRYPIC